MKKICLYLLFFISLNIHAENFPNFDTSTNIVTFPIVTVDNNDTYLNIRLLLDTDGSYLILPSESGAKFNLTGYWKGAIGNDDAVMITEEGVLPAGIGAAAGIPIGLNYYELLMVQTGSELTGMFCLYRNLVEPCFKEGIATENNGTINGNIVGNIISFKLMFDNNMFIDRLLEGIASIDQQSLRGAIVPNNFGREAFGWAFIRKNE